MVGWAQDARVVDRLSRNEASFVIDQELSHETAKFRQLDDLESVGSDLRHVDRYSTTSGSRPRFAIMWTSSSWKRCSHSEVFEKTRLTMLKKRQDDF